MCANPKSPQYLLFCKYQLLKYKPWRNIIIDAWNNLNDEDSNIFCEQWNEFLQSDLGQTLVPNWRRELHNAELYFERTELDDNDLDENLEGDREEWMHLADLCANVVIEADTSRNS